MNILDKINADLERLINFSSERTITPTSVASALLEQYAERSDLDVKYLDQGEITVMADRKLASMSGTLSPAHRGATG